MIQKNYSDLGTLTERQAFEMGHFDRLARKVAQESLSTIFDGPLNRSDSYVRFAVSRVLPVRGLVVLDYVCGLNGNAAFLAGNGAATVHSFDISLETLKILTTALETNPFNGSINLRHAAAEQLPYDNESFDLVYGNSALHHVNLQEAVPEIFRVLKKGGRAIFTEPLGENLALELIRKFAPYKDKIPRTPYEQPIKRSDVALIRQKFPDTDVTEFDLTAGLLRFFRRSGEYPTLERVDNFLRERFPVLRDYFRYVVIEMKK